MQNEAKYHRQNLLFATKQQQILNYQLITAIVYKFENKNRNEKFVFHNEKAIRKQDKLHLKFHIITSQSRFLLPGIKFDRTVVQHD